MNGEAVRFARNIYLRLYILLGVPLETNMIDKIRQGVSSWTLLIGTIKVKANRQPFPMRRKQGGDRSLKELSESFQAVQRVETILAVIGTFYDCSKLIIYASIKH